jgi:hypothetical protein
MAQALRDELLAVPGIAGAEVDADQGVAGVRVQLAVGADADAVGAAVRRILTQHGMRPIVPDQVDQEAGGPPPPPGAAGSVVTFPLIGDHEPTDVSAEPGLEGVSVEETPDGVAVAVRTADGRIAVRQLETGIQGMDDGVVAAVAETLAVPNAELVGAADTTMGERTVITVLIDIGGDGTVAGAAVQSGGRAFAVARAAWAALEPVRGS